MLIQCMLMDLKQDAQNVVGGKNGGDINVLLIKDLGKENHHKFWLLHLQKEKD